VILVTMKQCEGYSITVCKQMVLFVVNSNMAKRTQIRGRINRLSTPFPSITINTVVGGQLQKIMEKRYQRDDSFGAILKDFANGRLQESSRAKPPTPAKREVKSKMIPLQRTKRKVIELEETYNSDASGDRTDSD